MRRLDAREIAMPKKLLPQADVDRLHAEILEGKKTYLALAKEYGVSVSQVSRRAISLGVRKLTDSSVVPWRQIKCLYDDGISCNEIARKTGIGSHTIARHLRAYGYKLRTKNDYLKFSRVTITHLRDVVGLSWPHMSRKLGIDATSLRKTYTRWKIKNNQTPRRRLK